MQVSAAVFAMYTGRIQRLDVTTDAIHPTAVGHVMHCSIVSTTTDAVGLAKLLRLIDSTHQGPFPLGYPDALRIRHPACRSIWLEERKYTPHEYTITVTQMSVSGGWPLLWLGCCRSLCPAKWPRLVHATPRTFSRYIRRSPS